MKKRKKVSLKDIAKNTGFSVNTVSLALQSNPLISLKTSEIIKKVAKELGYIPNNIASALRSGKTKTLALIIPDIINPLFAIWAKRIEHIIRDKEYNIFIINTDEDYILEEKAIYLSLSKKVDGILICPTQKKISSIKFLKKTAVPFVLIGRHFKNLDTDYVKMDDFKGGFLATEHLIKKNRKRILYINAPSFITASRERLRGYKTALKKYNIEIDNKLIKEVNIVKPKECLLTIKNVIKKDIKFDAIFAWSDQIALEVINFLNEFNLKVPEDVAIVGFDNIQERLFFPFKITSINYSSELLVKRALDVLFEKINNPSLEPKYKIVIDTELFEGNSS